MDEHEITWLCHSNIAIFHDTNNLEPSVKENDSALFVLLYMTMIYKVQ